MKVAVDLLNLKGKGGCYCFMPYENTAEMRSRYDTKRGGDETKIAGTLN